MTTTTTIVVDEKEDDTHERERKDEKAHTCTLYASTHTHTYIHTPHGRVTSSE